MNYYIVNVYRNGDLLKTFDIECLSIDEANEELNKVVRNLQMKDAGNVYTASIEFEGFIKHG